jgi:hypothetical protein
MLCYSWRKTEGLVPGIRTEEIEGVRAVILGRGADKKAVVVAKTEPPLMQDDVVVDATVEAKAGQAAYVLMKTKEKGAEGVIIRINLENGGGTNERAGVYPAGCDIIVMAAGRLKPVNTKGVNQKHGTMEKLIILRPGDCVFIRPEGVEASQAAEHAVVECFKDESGAVVALAASGRDRNKIRRPSLAETKEHGKPDFAPVSKNKEKSGKLSPTTYGRHTAATS